MVFIFNFSSNVYASPSIADLEESAKYVNTYQKYAFKEDMRNLCKENKTKQRKHMQSALINTCQNIIYNMKSL